MSNGRGAGGRPTDWPRTRSAAVLDELDIAASPRLARDLVAVLPGRATLVLGSSQAPRDVALSTAARDGLRVVANRGVAGIDGTVSTAVGVALTADDDGPTVALMGDLTFLHDVTGLVIGPHEPRPDLTIVVSNNDGGAIFSTLEPGAPQHARAFDRVFGTPHGVMLAGAGRELRRRARFRLHRRTSWPMRSATPAGSGWSRCRPRGRSCPARCARCRKRSARCCSQ